MNHETVLTNVRLILENEIVDGSLAFDADGIRSIDASRSSIPAAIDCGADYVAPGLIEMHTDNLERHFVPRPGVVWPDSLGAAIAHDLQMAAAGVTTVFDALSAGYVYGRKDARGELFEKIADAIIHGVGSRAFRIDHRLHLRCELSGESVIEAIEPYIDSPVVALGSIMDHTPGQRQWRNLADLKTYAMGTSRKTEADFEADVKERMAVGGKLVAKHWPIVVDMLRSRGIPLATHDDTTPEHVELAIAAGAVISEFPTTIEAAEAAKRRGLATVAGAPNVVRGGSHSGGVAVHELAERGVLDGLSSDYVPASLLQAVHALNAKSGISLPEAIGMVTWRIADMVRMADRGRLAAGKRADVLRFRFHGATPVVMGLWSAGARVL